MNTFALLAGLLLSTASASTATEDAVLVCPVADAGWTGPQDRDIDYIVIDITGAGIVIDITGAGIVIDITGAGFACQGGWQGWGGFCTNDYAWVADEQSGPEWGFASALSDNSDLEVLSAGTPIAEYVSASGDEVVVDFFSTAGTGLLTPQSSALSGVTCQAYESYSDIVEF